MTGDPRGTVVVVTHDSSAVLGGFLASLAEGAPPHRWDLVVVDNASRDDTVDLATTVAPHAEVISAPGNDGYAAGVNRGVAAAGSGPVLVCNPDIRLDAGAADTLARALTPTVGIAVPRLRDADGQLLRSLRRRPTVGRALGESLLGGRAGRVPALGEVVHDRRRYERRGLADWAVGAAMMISRDCLDATGPWDESLFLYGEEVDFALRARAAGWRLRYEPAAGAVHLGGALHRDPALWALMTRNRLVVYGRTHGRAATAAFRGTAAVGEALRAATGSPRHRAGLAALRRPARDPLAQASRAPRDGPGWICFSAQDWWHHSRGHSDIQLMQAIARERPVLFVNSLGLRMPVPGRTTQPLRRIVRKAASTARWVRTPVPDTPGFHVLSPVLVPLYGSRAARRLNAAIVRLQVRACARWIGLGDDPVVVVTIPTACEVLDGLPHRTLVVNRSDRYSAFAEADRDVVAELERRLLTRADHVLYVSHHLMAEEAALTDGRAHFLDHGVDPAHFRPRPASDVPPDLQAIPAPRIGYLGALDDYKVDFALLERVAKELPDVAVVLVGDASQPMGALLALPNVHWLGPRPYEAVPRYAAGLDVALMPWQRNPWIEACNPIKLKEHLAVGLPVVTIDFPEVRRYAGHVTIAEDATAFVAGVRAALATPPRPEDAAARRAAVAGTTWADRAAELLRLAEHTGRH